MRGRDSATALALAWSLTGGGCWLPPLIASGDRFSVSPAASTDGTPTMGGSAVEVASHVPEGCRYLGLATGIGEGRAAEWETPEGKRAIATRALGDARNTAAVAGATLLVVDAEADYGAEAAVYGRAFRCPSNVPVRAGSRDRQ